MTKEDFQSLNPSEQEAFINNGGSIISEQVGLGSGVVASPDGVIASTIALPTNSSSAVHSLDSQPAPLANGEILNYDGVMIQDPVELLFLVDDNISSGRIKLHDWQIQIMLDFAKGGPDDKDPFQAVVRACNGSGKDKYIIAACCVWLCMRFKKSIAVVTSSSGAQLDNQTCRSIKQIAEAVNRKFGIEMWNCKYREYSLDFGDGSKSFVYCYATDEPKKAEGYHPIDFGARMGIFVSEDKSVPDEINVALSKCTGYTHRIHVSTPGLPMGHFFDYCSTAIDRKTITSIDSVPDNQWIQYHVTAHDCSHISKSYILQMERELPGGKLGAAYKSQVEAEFGTTDEMVVIPYTYVWKAYTSDIKWEPEPFNTGGLDLSDGGDETVLVVRNGNKHLATIPFRFDNTEDTITFLKEKFIEWGLNNKNALIYGDYGGLGAPMLKALKRQGWSNIRYIDSRSKAQQPKVYLNRGTELFFNVRKLFEEGSIILMKENKLIRQLSTRYYKINVNNIHQLLSKLESRSKGYPSPDQADAFNLCFWGYKSNTLKPEEEKPFETKEEEETKKEVGDFTLKAHAKGEHKKWTPNTGTRDFSYIKQEVAEYNNKLVNK